MQDANGSCGKVSSAWLISQGLEISLFFYLDHCQLGRRAKSSGFHMVRIIKECVSWHLGLRDQGNAFPNMEKGHWCLEGFNNIENNI